MKPEKSSKWSFLIQVSLIFTRRRCVVRGEGGFGGRDEVEEVGDTTSPVSDVQESSLRLPLIILKRIMQ